jgi:hypothetical protein
MPVREWGQSTDKKFKWVSLSAKYMPGVLAIIRNSFIINEAVSKVVGLAQSDKGTQQFENLLRLIAEDGISVVAVEVDSDIVVGAAMNKIQVINSLHLLIPTRSVPRAPICYICRG